MSRMRRFIASCAVAIATLGQASPGFSAEQEQVPVFQKTLVTSIKDPVTLTVAVSTGNITVGYSRDDQVTLYAYGKDGGGKALPQEFFKNKLIIEQKDNHVSIRETPGAGALLGAIYDINYRVDVPYRTEVDSTVSGAGNQTVAGVYGPATLVSGSGDIDAQYVRFAPVHANTGKGNISCIRDFGVDAATGDGSITLMENGDSKAVVKKGRGRIEVGGARGTVDGSTDAGSLHVKAVLSGDWQLKSDTGSIRVELPPKAKFEVDASSDSGEIAVEREDMQKPDGDEAHHVQQQVNGGGKRVVAHTAKGSIFIE